MGGPRSTPDFWSLVHLYFANNLLQNMFDKELRLSICGGLGTLKLTHEFVVAVNQQQALCSWEL
jgi:hypothetical protein